MKILTILLTALLMLSCGARKTNTLKSESEIKTEATVTENTTSVTTTGKSELTTTVQDNFVIVPVNPDKAIVVVKPNGETTSIFNARLEHTKTNTTAKAETKTKDTTITEKAAAVKTESKAATVTKATEREGFLTGRYLLDIAVIVVTVLFLLWLFVWRKKKTNEGNKI